jgi:hypothetical protein
MTFTNLVLLVGDHGFRSPRSRNSVATTLASRLPDRLGGNSDRLLVLDRTISAGSRAVLDLSIDSMLDLDRFRARAESADLYVSMNVADAAGATCNPFDWTIRWLRIDSVARSLGWTPRLVWLHAGESASKVVRRFGVRTLRALEGAKVSPLVVRGIDWRDAYDTGTQGSIQIASAIERDLDLDERGIVPSPVVEVVRGLSPCRLG